MKKLLTLFLFTVSCWVATGSLAQSKTQKNFKPSLANSWLDIALEVTANDVDRVGAKPTIQARQLGIAMNAMFDAWACYDDKAVVSVFGG